MKRLRMRIGRVAYYSVAAATLLTILIFAIVQIIGIIRYENRGEIGKAELFVKGIEMPQGLVLDQKGRLFVQSAADGKISIIKNDGIVMDYSYIDEFYGYGISLDPSNNFIIANRDRVAIVNNSGYVLRVTEGFKRAYDVAMGPNRTVFVSDSETNLIYCISPDNKISVFAELGEKKSDSVPNATGICFDKDMKNLYALNMYSGELYKISLSVEIKADKSAVMKADKIEVIAANLQGPNFIDLDEESNIYITCQGDNTVIRINRNSIKELIDTKGKMSNIAGIAVASNGPERILYVASSDSNSIYRIFISSNN